MEPHTADLPCVKVELEMDGAITEPHTHDLAVPALKAKFEPGSGTEEKEFDLHQSSPESRGMSKSSEPKCCSLLMEVKTELDQDTEMEPCRANLPCVKVELEINGDMTEPHTHSLEVPALKAKSEPESDTEELEFDSRRSSQISLGMSKLSEPKLSGLLMEVKTGLDRETEMEPGRYHLPCVKGYLEADGDMKEPHTHDLAIPALKVKFEPASDTEEQEFDCEHRNNQGDYPEHGPLLAVDDTSTRQHYCGQVFSQSSNLKTYRVLTGEIPYQYTDCGKAFHQSCNLKMDQSVHPGDKPSKCSDWRKPPENSKTHPSVHKGDKPYQCTDCGKAFNRSDHLKTHQRVHTGDRPYKCTDCGKAFIKSDHLKAHQRVHTGDKPYKCTDCDKAFCRSCDLKKHQRVHPGEKLIQSTVSSGTSLEETPM